MIALTLAVLLFTAAVASGERLTKLLVGHLPVTGHAKFYVAKERGFFADEGLDVELIDYTNSSDGLAAIKAGKLDVGAYGTASPLVYIAAGADVRIIGGIMGEDAFVVAKPEIAGQIASPADLRGRPVATVRFSSGDVVLRQVLLQAGLSWERDLPIMELSDPLSVLRAVKNDQIEAGVIWGPHDITVVREGLAVVFATADLFPGHPCCRVVVTGQRFRDKAGAWPGFMRAILLAERFTRDPAHRADTVADIGKYIVMPPETIERAYYQGRLDQASDPNRVAVEAMWEVLAEAGMIRGENGVAKHIEFGPFEEALRSLEAAEPDEPYWRGVRELYESRNRVMVE